MPRKNFLRFLGREGFEPSKGVARQIYSLVHLTALPPTRKTTPENKSNIIKFSRELLLAARYPRDLKKRFGLPHSFKRSYKMGTL